MNTLVKIISFVFLIFFILLTYLYWSIFVPVNAVNYPVISQVVQGESLSLVSDKLYGQKIIKNKFVFENFIKLTRQDSKIQIGEYTYHKPLNMVEILNKLITGRYEYIPVIITIKEGEDSRTIVDKIYNNFKNVKSAYSKEELLQILQDKEGYLFPETYNYAPSASLENIFKKIDEEFIKRTSGYSTSTEDFKKILIIASILEKEVPHPEDMKVVSGIIQNRLKIGMPLQMDSTLGYFTGRASLQLTRADLQLDSPYNTYKIKGLPTAPIGNPGDVSIQAAISPESHDYIYFLSGSDGVNHYAKTYEEHLKNRRLYLGK
jgi:UPF0755 protein